MSDRPSPTQSSTSYKVGTKKKGNDGNMWIIVKTKSGTHRWSKLTPRPSPTQRATSHKVGTKKKGNDGNMWIITKTKSGTHRWKKIDK